MCVSRLLPPRPALPQPALTDVPVSIKVSLVDFYSKSLQTAGPKRVCVRVWVGVCVCVCSVPACLAVCLSVCLATAAVICQARRQGNQAIKQLTPDCVCLCVRVPVCVCQCACVCVPLPTATAFVHFDCHNCISLYACAASWPRSQRVWLVNQLVSSREREAQQHRERERGRRSKGGKWS